MDQYYTTKFGAVTITVTAATQQQAQERAYIEFKNLNLNAQTQLEPMIAQYIKDRRHDLKISPPEIADQLGVSVRQYHKYETAQDRITATRLIAISQILQFSLDEMVQTCQKETLKSP